MKSLMISSVTVLLLTTQAAFAQPYRNSNPPGAYGPYSRPGLSPYLNLIRGGDPAANYYLGVVPERDRRALGLQQGAQLFDLEERAAAGVSARPDPKEDPRLPGTGHPAYFFNYSGYYNFGSGARGSPTPPTMGGQRRTR